jgi:hypothetical protein
VPVAPAPRPASDPSGTSRRRSATLDDAQLAPALLGCIEAALQDLVSTVAALEQTCAEVTAEHSGSHAEPRSRLSVERMQRANLQEALTDAERAAAAARPLVARAVAAHGARGNGHRAKADR